MNVLVLSAIMGVIMMFSGIIFQDKKVVRAIGIGGVSLLLCSTIYEKMHHAFFSFNTQSFFAFDDYSLTVLAVLLLCTLLYFLISGKDMEYVGKDYAEYFALIFFIICGMALVLSFKSLLILFLGIEIISIPLYILTGSDKLNLKSNEASLKYFLMGSFSTGIMLMGIAFLYGATGSFLTDNIATAVTAKPGSLLIAGMMLLLVALAFKVSIAPFHNWTPDVYDGAPTVFTSYMASMVKVAVFVGFIKLFDDSFSPMQPKWKLWIAIMIALTLFIGNITAVFQQSVKRMLAYSSITQAGFMLLSIYALNESGKQGLLLYAIAYCLATIGIFSVLIKMKDYTYSGFYGLARNQPIVAACMVIFLFSLAGIPLTAGFLAKLFMIKAAISTAGASVWFIIFIALMAALSIYYYFRVIQSMYFKEGNATIEATTGYKVLLIILAALLILIGVFPNLFFYFFYFI